MIRVPVIVCLGLMFIAGCRSGNDGTEPAAPAGGEVKGAATGEVRAGEAAAVAEAKGEEVTPGGDRPGAIGCMDCGVIVCARDGAFDGGLRLDTARLDLSGATATGAKLRIEAGSGESISVPVIASALKKSDAVLSDPIKGLPSPEDGNAWRSPKAELLLDYTTSKGVTGTVPMQVGSVEVKNCQ